MEVRRLQVIGSRATLNIPKREADKLGWNDKDNIVIDINYQEKTITLTKLEEWK